MVCRTLPFLPVLCLTLALGAEPPSFTARPTAKRDGEKVKIEFAADRDTDVAVYVENAKGEIVRHLAAGMLGAKAPEPLKAGAPEQSLVWDGKDDDGKPASGGPFKVRVGLGLTASYGGAAFSEKSGPNHIDSVRSLAVGPEGRLYVVDNRYGWLYYASTGVHILDRSGDYQRTILPFPPNLSTDKLRGAAAFQASSGVLTPVIHLIKPATLYPYDPQGPIAVTSSGRAIICAVPVSEGGSQKLGTTPHLMAIDPDGSVPWAKCAGPALLGGARFSGPSIAVGTDGQTVYLTGLGKSDKAAYPAVYRVKNPETDPAEVFFGDPASAGKDEKHLNAPACVAADGKGLLYIADKGNSRVVIVKEADAGFVGAMDVPAPSWVGVHPKTGVVCVDSNNTVIKFSDRKDAKEVSRLALPKSEGHPGCRLALDASAEPAVLWVGRSHWAAGMKNPLLRCEDQGAKFGDLQPTNYYASPKPKVISADPLRREVSCKDDALKTFMILDEASGQVQRVSVGGGGGSIYRLGLDGKIYQMSGGMRVFDRKGKEIGRPEVRTSGTTCWERDFGLDRKGNLYARNRGEVYHGYHRIDKYGPDLKNLGTVIWCVTDGQLGPRLDARGNLYIADAVKPVGKRWPEEFDGKLPRHAEHWYDWTYGSVIKFTPRGGSLWLPLFPGNNFQEKGGPDVYAFTGELKLDPSLKKEPVDYWRRNMKPQATVQGAEWLHFGFSRVEDMKSMGGDHCHCTGCDFDVDDFGRTFYPDEGRFRVTVLDTAGNVITHIGAYGNQDCWGPDSYVLDPATKQLRPRRPNDPKDLVSPFAEPEVAIGWVVGLAVTDRNLYVADLFNRRTLRVKLGYAATETVAVP
jgi:hypothetical protein